MKKRRQAIKRRTPQKIKERSYNKLYKEVERQVKETNARLKSLERYHDSNTWASGKLKKRISSNKTKGLMYKGKRIKLKQKMTKTNLIQVQKATKQFLDSATSTNKGIKKVKESTVKSIKDTLNLGRDKSKRLSDKDAEFLYTVLEDKGVRDIVNEIGASTLWSEIRYASDNNLSENSFIDRLNMYMSQDMDIDLQEQARHIYRTYVI